MSIFDGKSPRAHMWACLLGSWGVILFAVVTSEARSDAILPIAIILLIAILALWVVVLIRRLNDLQRSRWWAIGFLVPIFNLALVIGLLFRAGTAAVPETDTSTHDN